MNNNASHPLRSARVLITGATGFLGRRVVERAAEIGADVVATSRVVSRPTLDADWRRLDLSDPAAVQRLLTKVSPDVVIHLSGASTGAQRAANLLPTFEANLRSTVILADALLQRGAGRLVTAGSMEEPAADDPTAPIASPYIASKWAATMYARHCHERFGLAWADLRVFTVYGPRHESYAKLIPQTIRAAQRGAAPLIASPGREIDPVYIDDVADAFLAAAHRREALGCSTDVGGGESVTIAELASQILRRIDPSLRAVIRPGDNRDEVSRRADLAPAAARLGWRPRMALSEGLDRTIAWYESRALAPGRRSGRARRAARKATA